MPILRNGVESDSRVLEPPTLEVLLAVAARHSRRCYICRWIVANQGCRTDLLNPLPIAGVTISADSQQLHLAGHLDAGSGVTVADSEGVKGQGFREAAGRPGSVTHRPRWSS